MKEIVVSSEKSRIERSHLLGVEGGTIKEDILGGGDVGCDGGGWGGHGDGELWFLFR